MKMTYTNFVISENQSLIPDQSDTTEIRNSKSLTETINKTAIDTGIESKDCIIINEEEGYAIAKNDHFLTVLTVGNYYDHPIAKMIEDNRVSNPEYLEKKIRELI